jgi:hypothetical protein
MDADRDVQYFGERVGGIPSRIVERHSFVLWCDLCKHGQFAVVD